MTFDQDPDRQPRRDRAAGRTRLPRARHRGRSRCTPPPTANPPWSGSPTRPCTIGPGPVQATATCTSPPSSRPRARPGAEAIHPGYGFLSEDPYFAEICDSTTGIVFIGPAAGGDAAGSATRRPPAALMHEAGLPLLPGTIAPVATVDRGDRSSPTSIGYPVILKAVAGGGGRGMSVVRDRGDLPARLRRRPARERARPCSATSGVYLERFLEDARGTSRSRCSATSTATASTSASATARSSAGIRS